jgi:hypothetical protein
MALKWREMSKGVRVACTSCSGMLFSEGTEKNHKRFPSDESILGPDWNYVPLEFELGVISLNRRA